MALKEAAKPAKRQINTFRLALGRRRANGPASIGSGFQNLLSQCNR
jgi:hypothetical protein